IAAGDPPRITYKLDVKRGVAGRLRRCQKRRTAERTQHLWKGGEKEQKQRNFVSSVVSRHIKILRYC
ncbi:MAG: hypothetical protein K9J45_02830, partial [Bacteroidales bacterium]|nr:hypothetical protein [Bacteroidales bacterium]